MTLASSIFHLLIAALGVHPISSACPTCLEVFSIDIFTHLGPTAEAHVKVQPLPSGCVTVVSGTWTDPNGGTVTRNSIASGTRRRAEFPIYSDLYGTFVFNVDDINCGTEYTYIGNDTATVTIEAPAPAPTPTIPTPPEPSCLAAGEACSRKSGLPCCNGTCRRKLCQ